MNKWLVIIIVEHSALEFFNSHYLILCPLSFHQESLSLAERPLCSFCL